MEIPRFSPEPLQEEDFFDLMLLENTCFSELDRWSENSMRKEIQENSDGFRVVRYNGHLIGYVQFQVGYDRLTKDSAKDDNDGLVGSIAVHPDFRRQGIGTALMRSALDNLRERSVSKIILGTRVSNHGMIRLSESVGFKATRIKPGYFDNEDGTKEDAISMEH